MKTLICGLLMLLPTMALAQVEQPTTDVLRDDRLARIHDATVRVSVSGGTGTGTIYKEDKDYYYVLTNEHVAGKVGTSVGLEFTKDHYPSPRFVGTVTKSINRPGLDVAEVRILKKSLPEGLTLPVIPLAEAGDAPRELYLITAGCQAGERPSIQMTLTLEDKGKLIYYLPTSRPGRSGSSLVNREGTKIYGLVAWMTGGRDSKGLAMGVEVIRPFLTGEALQTVSTQDFPEDAFEIPLATDQFVGSEILALSEAQDTCPPDSCFDDKCPWDYQYVTDEARKRDNPWLRRYGGPAQPINPQPQPEAPAAPQDDSNPWTNPLPKKDDPTPPPAPEEDRRRLLDFSRLMERFDRIEPKIDRIEPKLEELGPKLDELKPDPDDQARQRRLFQRIESLPDKLIGPEDLNQFAERQSTTLIDRLRNAIWVLFQPFVWAWWIAATLGILWALNLVLSPVFGANWFSVILLWLVAFGRKIVSVVLEAWTALRQPLKQPEEQPKPVKRTRKPRAKKTEEKVDA